MPILASLLTLIACGGAPCELNNGTTYADGETWTCDDGCNTCACEDGAVASTEMYCAASCTDATGTHTEGETWTCEDGCNTCSCTSDGTVESTDMDCVPAVTCTDTTGTYEVGETWTCPDGCNTCACEPDGSIVSTDMACG